MFCSLYLNSFSSKRLLLLGWILRFVYSCIRNQERGFYFRLVCKSGWENINNATNNATWYRVISQKEMLIINNLNIFQKKLLHLKNQKIGLID